MVEKHLTGIRRFGTRYGRTLKLKFAKIEAEQRKKHKCPYCNALKVKRVAVGIWNCGKCGTKFTGKAYTISKKPVEVQQAPVQEIPELIEEPEEQEGFEEEPKSTPSQEEVQTTTNDNEGFGEKQYETPENNTQDTEDFGEEETDEGVKEH